VGKRSSRDPRNARILACAKPRQPGSVVVEHAACLAPLGAFSAELMLGSKRVRAVWAGPRKYHQLSHGKATPVVIGSWSKMAWISKRRERAAGKTLHGSTVGQPQFAGTPADRSASRLRYIFIWAHLDAD